MATLNKAVTFLFASLASFNDSSNSYLRRQSNRFKCDLTVHIITTHPWLNDKSQSACLNATKHTRSIEPHSVTAGFYREVLNRVSAGLHYAVAYSYFIWPNVITSA